MSCVSKILCQKCNPASSTACAHFNKVTSHRIRFSCWSSTALKPKFKPWALHKLTLFYYRHTSVRRKKKKFLQVKYFPDLFLNSNTPLFHCHLGLFVSCQNANIFIALPFQSHSFSPPSSRASAQHLLTWNLALLSLGTKYFCHNFQSTKGPARLCWCHFAAAPQRVTNTVLSPLFKILIPRSWIRKLQAAGTLRSCQVAVKSPVTCPYLAACTCRQTRISRKCAVASRGASSLCTSQ